MCMGKRRWCIYNLSLYGVLLFFGQGGVVCKYKRCHYMYKSPLCVCTTFCGACTRRHLGVNVKGAAVCIITSLCVYGVVVLCV